MIIKGNGVNGPADWFSCQSAARVRVVTMLNKRWCPHLHQHLNWDLWKPREKWGLTSPRAKKRMRRIPQASMERPSSSTSGWYWLMQENFLYSASFFSSWQFSRYFPLAGMAHNSCRGISGVRMKPQAARASPQLQAAKPQVWGGESRVAHRVPSLPCSSWCSSESAVDPPAWRLQLLHPTTTAKLLLWCLLSCVWCWQEDLIHLASYCVAPFTGFE